MRSSFFLLGVCVIGLAGCQKHPQTDYSALDQSGMWSSSLDELKKLKVTDMEIAQLAKIKQAGAPDDFCLDLTKAARAHQHEFTSGDAVVDLSRAGYTDVEIMAMAKADRLDIMSGDAVTLKLIGLSNSTVQAILHRRVQGLPTLTSEQIGRLKNTGMSEKQILEVVNQGYPDDKAEAFIKQREAVRDHSNTGFVRVRGRRRR
jgi:alkylhydroperoxidase family enzyme